MKRSFLQGIRGLLLDMNGTFMFGGDRFGEDEDFSSAYRGLGGKLPGEDVNRIIRGAYDYLAARYPNPQHRDCFPSVERAIVQTWAGRLPGSERKRLVDTFALHELGRIPTPYVEAMGQLQQSFQLGAVIDIWAPKGMWLQELRRSGALPLFSALSFSSDHGRAKPSPKPFRSVLRQLGLKAGQAVVVGDSPRRDLGGASAAGLGCVLVGEARHPQALACFRDLLEFSQAVIDAGR